MERIRFRHFCQSVFGGSLHARSPRLELLDNHQACMSLLSPGKCMPVVKTPPESVSDSESRPALRPLSFEPLCRLPSS